MPQFRFSLQQTLRQKIGKIWFSWEVITVSTVMERESKTRGGKPSTGTLMGG